MIRAEEKQQEEDRLRGSGRQINSQISDLFEPGNGHLAKLKDLCFATNKELATVLCLPLYQEDPDQPLLAFLSPEQAPVSTRV